MKLNEYEEIGIRDNKIISLLNKIEKLSLNYHKMSLLFNELFQSIKYQARQGKKFKELKEGMNLDVDKIEDLSRLRLTDLKKKENED